MQIAAATLLPPLRPRATMYGTSSRRMISLLSTTLTKPTGTPMISAGRSAPAAICSWMEMSAVGALPIAKMQGFGRRAARNLSGMKNRQPLGDLFVKADFTLSEYDQAIIRDELNVKRMAFSDDLKVEYQLKPQLKTVGPKFGKLVGGIRDALASLDGAAAVQELNENGMLRLTVNGEDVELIREDLLIEIAQSEGFVTQADQGVTVMLSTALTPELIEEGFVRELISKIQTMRKEAGFEVMDHIRLYAEGNDAIAGILSKNEEEIRGEVLAEEVACGSLAGYTKEWDINGETVTLGVEKV